MILHPLAMVLSKHRFYLANVTLKMGLGWF